MNHLAFFGLDREPFLITPDRNFFYPSSSHLAAREVLAFGLEQGEGFMVLTGEVGSGKTLLLRLLIADLPQRYETALILSPHLSPRELVTAILHDIDAGLLDSAGAEAGMDWLLRRLNEHLSRLAEQDRRLLVIIDEAQNLPDESLEQLRLLSNFESDTCKLVQILLVGQPELRQRLADPGLRQLWQRISVVEQLQPLTRDDVGRYINYRLRQAGGGRLYCTRTGIDLLWRYSRGIPRLINKALNRALLIAFSSRETTISRDIVADAIETLAETALLKKEARRRRLRFALAATALVLTGMALTAVYYPGLPSGVPAVLDLARNLNPFNIGAP